MGIFVRSWKQLLGKLKHAHSSPRAGRLERKLAAAREEKQALLTEIADIEVELADQRGRDKEQLKAVEQRLGRIEAEREAATRQLQTLGHSLSVAITQLENTESRVSQLNTRLEKERRKHRDEIQAAQDRTRRQERRLNWAFMVAGFAVLLGAVASATKIWDSRNNARVLAELSRDIKDIKASMQQQLGGMQESLEDYRQSLLDELSARPAPDPQPALAGKPEELPDRQRSESAQAMPTYGFHPHNKYRTIPEMKAFFEDNARGLGVVTLDSGLQYRVLSHGNGRLPDSTDRVEFDYRAFLPDGTEIYNSYDAAEPVAFGIDQLKPGLREALLRMEEGAQWELYIPPRLAYRGGVRKRKKYGYAPLIYVVELRSVIEGGQSIEN